MLSPAKVRKPAWTRVIREMRVRGAWAVLATRFVPMSESIPGNVIAGRYELVRALGRGAFGRTGIISKRSSPSSRRIASNGSHLASVCVKVPG